MGDWQVNRSSRPWRPFPFDLESPDVARPPGPRRATAWPRRDLRLTFPAHDSGIEALAQLTKALAVRRAERLLVDRPLKVAFCGRWQL